MSFLIQVEALRCERDMLKAKVEMLQVMRRRHMIACACVFFCVRVRVCVCAYVHGIFLYLMHGI